MTSRLPTLAILLGVAGLIPFIFLSIASVSANPNRGIVSITLLISYGAVVLAFLGAVHWGLTLGVENDRVRRTRLLLGVVPALIGWAAIVAALGVGLPVLGVGVLIAGFVATVVTESRAHRSDLLPAGYMVYRWALSTIVVALLTTVVVLRLVGGHVLF